MVRCPQCKTEFSEIDQPCKRCVGGCFQWHNKSAKTTLYNEPSALLLSTKEWKKTPCARCNGTGTERSAANRNNRSRGSSNEYKAIRFFEEHWKGPNGEAYQFKRTPQSGGSELADGFDMAGDICTTAPDFIWHVECKRDKGWEFTQLLTTPGGARLGEFIEQALGDCPPHRVPMLFLMHPGPSQPTYIMVLRHVLTSQHSVMHGTAVVGGIQIVPYTIMTLKHFASLSPAQWKALVIYSPSPG